MSSAPNAPTRGVFLAFGIAIALVGGAAAGLPLAVSALQLHLTKKPIHAPRKVHSVPAQTPSWTRLGQDQQMSEAMVEELDTENYLSRRYVRRAADGRIGVDLHLAYYTGMVDTVPHVPERCMVGGGWQPGEGADVIPLRLDVSGWPKDRLAPEGVDPVRTARLANDPAFTDSPGETVRLPRGVESIQVRVQDFNAPDGKGGRVYVGYFFIANGKTMASANRVREEAFNLREDYAYYLKIQLTVGGVSSTEEFMEVARDLTQELLPEIMRCVPDWSEVEAGIYEHPGGTDALPVGRTE